MANKNLFQSIRGALLPVATIRNDAGGTAYPRPADAAREAFYAWLVGKPWDAESLPEILRAFEAWKISRDGEVPDVPFQMLTALELGEREILKSRNPAARMVCIDLVPNTTTQAPVRKDILNIGGFSDRVFDLIAGSIPAPALAG